MGRVVAAVVVGYVVVVAAVFGLFTLTWTILGADRSFRPGTWDVSAAWIAGGFVVNLLASIAGGFVAAAIARSASGAKGLAGLVLVLGVLFAVPAFTATPASEPRTGEVSMFDAMGKARTPAWIAALNPVIGVVGALLGGRLRR